VRSARKGRSTQAVTRSRNLADAVSGDRIATDRSRALRRESRTGDVASTRSSGKGSPTRAPPRPRHQPISWTRIRSARSGLSPDTESERACCFVLSVRAPGALGFGEAYPWRCVSPPGALERMGALASNRCRPRERIVHSVVAKPPSRARGNVRRLQTRRCPARRPPRIYVHFRASLAFVWNIA
jgi:hypothetical protein